MSIIEEFIGTFFQEVLWRAVRRLGSSVRWLFLRKKYTYTEIYQQEWNGRVGLLTIVFFLSFCFVLFGSFNQDRKFNKAGWAEREDLGTYPLRDKMLNDLLKNYKIKGLTLKQLVGLIGEPESNMVGESNTIYYDIINDYRWDIDPVYIKTLAIKFDADSIVREFKVRETKHEYTSR